MLHVERVSKMFGGLKALCEISLTVHEGQTVGIIGPNGSGKTTLFNVITGYLKPTSGNVELDRKSLVRLNPEQISKMGIARTFQSIKPFSKMTVLENAMVGAFVRTPSVREARKIAYECLELTGLTSKIAAYPFELSLPDRKKLELARALSTRPKILLLDEVFSGFTPSEIQEAIELIRTIRVSTGITIMFIEHNVRVVSSVSDYLYVIHNGKLIQEGKPGEVLTSEEVITAYLGDVYRGVVGSEKH